MAPLVPKDNQQAANNSTVGCSSRHCNTVIIVVSYIHVSGYPYGGGGVTSGQQHHYQR
ncbi:hypothetical protein B7P43_G08184 [Cryptotermes secundus]|uniref:Uncharacterized protein n=1 Tax=Cryptotermes secundus TaxID=105785 RepID=A0A2J7RI31_9NEOP|nr:hypothetical protein B7P43_G08184 [Cryptotermes secundus]